MKRALLRIAIVILVFVSAVLITENIMNHDSEDMTTEMTKATLPVVSIEYNGIEINRMYGYETDMDLCYMRESITPLMAGRKIHFNIDTYGVSVVKITYEIRTVDGERLIEDTTVTDITNRGINIEANAILKDLIEENAEYELILHLTLDNGKNIKYYTRIINPTEYYISDKLEYVSDFSTKTFNKVMAEDLIKYLESNASGDNSSFGKVDIHSNFNQVTWGDLEPLKITDSVITIKELAPLTGSFLVDYYVSTKEETSVKYYKVREFYRVRYSKERMYLLDYERTMDEVFVEDKSSYFEDNVMFGIKSGDIPMKESENGESVAFVVNGRLYAMNLVENRVAYLFGFFDSYTEDERMMNDNHSIKVMNVDEAGNVTFLVYGYMNRGSHEGKVGACAYYYNAELNTIEELAYMPSRHSPDLLIKEIDKLSYMNSNGKLYLLMGSKLYEVDSESRSATVIASDLKEGGYVISDNNHMVAWQQGEGSFDSQELVLMNLETGVKKEIKVPVSQTLSPIDFIGEDLIYGIADKNDIVKDRTGKYVIPMFQINIENEREDILMEYHKDGIFVVNGEVNMNQIVLHRVTKDENGNLAETTKDQIMNSEDVSSTKNYVKTIVVDLYEKLTQLSLNKPIKPESLKHLTPKMILFEGSREIDLTEDLYENPYVVYGKYGADSFYLNANTSVERAYDISGIVMNNRGNYVWKKTSRSPKNQIMAIEADLSTESRGSLAICIDTMLELEGVVRNAQYMLSEGEGVIDILKSALPEYEILDLTGCSLEMILYYVNQDIPVLCMMDDGSAVLVIGFNDTQIVLMDPSKGEIYKIAMDSAIEKFEENGNCFITYIPRPVE